MGMSTSMVHSALNICEKVIRERSDTPAMQLVPYRNMEALGHYNRLSHILWMIESAHVFIDDGKSDKAHRWLGFIQGYLWAQGLQTIEAAKQANMPGTDTYEKTHV